MPRLQPINRTTAPADVLELLVVVENQIGMVPNMIATMAQSTAVTQAYLGFAKSLSQGLIDEQLREQIALAVSQANRCGYCVSGHSAIGSSVGLTQDQLRDARSATSPNRKTEAVLQFTRRIIDKQGAVSDDDIDEIFNAGYGEAEIAEVVGHVALNVFANYFNLVAKTEIDFPPVEDLASSKLY